MSLATPIAPALERQAVVADTAPCLYCGGTDYQPLYAGIEDRLGHVPGEWSFVKCQCCGSAMLSPTPKAEDLPAFYPPVYTFAPELAKPGTLKRWLANLEYNIFFRTIYDAQVRLVTRHTNRPKGSPGKLLDIGCGRGLRLRHFQKHGYDVSAMDFVADATDYVASELKIEAVCTDIPGLTSAFAAEEFDVITAFSVAEHLLDLDMALAASLQLLKPGGWIALHVPLVDSFQASAFGKHWLGFTEAPRHVSVPSRQGLSAVLIAAGFEAPSIKHIPDSALGNAALAGLSLFPGGAATNSYGTGRATALLKRICGALTIPAVWTWAVFENTVLCRPAQGIVFARKPLE
jgi:SAM-dependent methyltransferase